MKAKDKLLIIGALFFVLIGVGPTLYDNNFCSSKWRTIERNLDYIRTANSIVEIKIYPTYSDSDINLVTDTVTITDRIRIERIQKMITSRYLGTWNRPIASWDTQMKLILDDNRAFDFRVSKINNDKLESMTHLYFGSRYCRDSSPSCSEALGPYLETLTAYESRTK